MFMGLPDPHSDPLERGTDPDPHQNVNGSKTLPKTHAKCIQGYLNLVYSDAILR